jgi:hypothetical protein
LVSITHYNTSFLNLNSMFPVPLTDIVL